MHIKLSLIGNEVLLKLFLAYSPTIFTANFGLLLGPVDTFSIFLRVNMPSITFPNTTCFPSRCPVGAAVMKNWDPLVFGPAFACNEKGVKNVSEHSAWNLGPYHWKQEWLRVFDGKRLIFELLSINGLATGSVTWCTKNVGTIRRRWQDSPDYATNPQWNRHLGS